MTELENKRLIAKNTVALYVRMIVRLLVTLYTSRIVLSTLGFDDFAIYGIVGGIVTVFTFLQSALNASNQRFMSIELGKGNTLQLKKVFDTGMTLYLFVALIIVILSETAGLWFLTHKLVIPPERMQAAHWVFQFSILSVCINIIQTPYNASILSHEKMSFYAYISIADVVLKLGIVGLLVVSSLDKLILYAGLLTLVALIILLITRYYCLARFPVCHFKWQWDKPLFKQMMGFSGWTLCDSAANLAVTQGRVFLLNLFTPLVTNAAMSVATQVSTAVYNFVIYFQSSFNPQITKAYAKDDRNYLLGLIIQTSKFSYYMIFALTLPILLNMEFILNVWLKDVPDYCIAFCSITLIYYLVESLCGPLWTATWATGNIRNYQITLALIRILTLPATYFLLKYGMEPYTILIAWVIVNTAGYIYRLFYLRKQIRFPLTAYLKEVLGPVVLISLLAVPLPWLTHRYLNGWTDLIITTFVSLAVTGLLIWLLGLTPSEKKHIGHTVKVRVK